MAVEQKKILEITAADLNQLAPTQIGQESGFVDSEIDYLPWGGKDQQGNVTRWLALDHNARVSNLRVTGDITLDGSLVSTTSNPQIPMLIHSVGGKGMHIMAGEALGQEATLGDLRLTTNFGSILLGQYGYKKSYNLMRVDASGIGIFGPMRFLGFEGAPDSDAGVVISDQEVTINKRLAFHPVPYSGGTVQDDSVVIVATSTSITLPDIEPNKGRQVIVCQKGGTSVYVSAGAGNYINGSTTVVVSVPGYSAKLFIADGVDRWFTIG